MTVNAQASDRPRGGFHIFADLSLRVKLILVFLVVSLFAVGLIAFLNIRSTSAALTRQVYEDMTGLSSAEATLIGSVLAERVESMQTFAQGDEAQADVVAQNTTYGGGEAAILSELTRLDEEWKTAGDDDPLIRERVASELDTDEAAKAKALARELLEMTRIIPHFVEAFVTDRYGGLVAASHRTSDYYQADEDWWQAAYNEGRGAVYIGEPELDESSGVVGVDIAVPIYDHNNQVAGVLRTTLDAGALVKRLTSIELGETGQAGLFLGNKVFIAHQEQEEAEHASEVAAVLTGQTAPQGHLEANLAGQPTLMSYASVSSPAGEEFISNLGWKVVVHQAQSEALAAVTAQTRNSLLLALFVIGITVVVAIAMGQVLANPIAHLSRTVARFAGGDLSARVHIDTRDETGTLAASFNQMAEQVGNLLTQVQARSTELEERTRELEASQRVTFAASERTTPEELLGLVVDLVRDQFDLYHVQVYMVDAGEGAAVLRESTGYAGSQLLQQGHRIPLDREQSLVAKAIRENQPVLVDDVSQDEHFMPNPLLPETRTELVVPLRLGERVLGALDIQDRTPGRFSESTVSLFQAMADQVAFLFENNELLARVTDQTETLSLYTTQLRTAADIAGHLSTLLDPEQMLHEMAELLQSRFGLYHAHIYVLDEEKRELVVRAGSGEVGRVLRERGHSIPLDAEKSLVARAARSREPVLVEDTSLRSDFMPNPLLPQTRSELSVPLVVGEQVLGVLDIQDDQANRFAASDVDTFMTLAGLAASSLQNARLFEAQKRAEEALRESEERFRSMVEHSHTGVLLIDEAFRFVYVNEQMCQISGYSQDEMIGMDFRQLLDEENLKLVVDYYTRRQRGEQVPDRYQFALTRKDGEKRIVEMAAAVVTDAAGNRRSMGQVLDVTEQVRAEEALRDSEERFRGLYETSPLGIILNDYETGDYLEANQAFVDMIGYSIEELNQLSYWDLTPQKYEPDEQEQIRSMEKTGRYGPYQKEYIRKDGVHIPVVLNGVLVTDRQGRKLIWSTVADITYRIESEERLRQSQMMLQAVMDNLPQSIFWKDRDLVYLGCNQNFADDAGLASPEEVIGKTDYDMPWLDQAELYRADDRKVIETGQPVLNYEEPQTTPSGDTIWLRTSKVPLYDAQGNVYAVLGAYEDITEEKRAEQLIRENQERLELALEAANAGVWEFWPQDDKAFFNERWFTMLGYAPDELEHSYATWRSLLHPDDLERVEGVVMPAVQSGKDFVIDFRMKTKDGGWRWIHDIGKTVEWTEDGAARRMIGTHTLRYEDDMAEVIAASGDGKGTEA